MMIYEDTKCRCGHRASAHTSGVFPDPDGVDLATVQNNDYHHCGRCENAKSECLKFELPNLDLIEYLAEQRGLI